MNCSSMTWIVERDERLKIIKNLDIQAAKKMLPTNMTDTGLLIALHKLMVCRCCQMVSCQSE